MTRLAQFGVVLAACLFGLYSEPSFAQLVSVQCCTGQADLDRIGECVSGPDVFDRPVECTAGATCIFGFGPDDSMMAALCDASMQAPDFSRGFCDSWVVESIPAVHECVAKPAEGITLFELFDVDEENGQDGDIDAIDLGTFYAAYDAVPKLEQAEAKLVFVECCIPSSMPSELSDCLSGPGNTTEPPDCLFDLACTAGFTAPLEPGDWLYKTCAQVQDNPDPDPPPAFMVCQRWNATDQPSAFRCRVAHLPGHSLFVVADLDGDEDVDLADYALLQQNTAQ